ncbi:MAG: hypothetical protein NUV31_10245 [Dehalococcoidales bacterium]|nr:hypothetical protein [Dehalococcoidales bacterium]
MNAGFARNLLSRDALLIGLYGGVAGVLVDADHLFWGYRAWHLPLFALSCLVLIGCFAYIGGLYLCLVLKRKRKTIRN